MPGGPRAHVDTVTEIDARAALWPLRPLWDELSPAEQLRIAKLLLQRGDIGTDGHLSDLAEGGMVFLCPQGQLSAPFADDRLSRSVAGLPSLVECVRHLFGHG